ncbi:hypothetical protein M2350_000116 [Candidatus Fervidibacter sacchari]|uniref:EGF-like domain-containing protein n=1 Tax=Candidatus Fervidibacter sacchari TaxID=1448929 RepID=A0ABT2EIE9_9BACT|nr:hypothetical protein [Candidatus Fervidibacter sacchari]
MKKAVLTFLVTVLIGFLGQVAYQQYGGQGPRCSVNCPKGSCSIQCAPGQRADCYCNLFGGAVCRCY